jgi:hypothetical protein
VQSIVIALLILFVISGSIVTGSLVIVTGTVVLFILLSVLLSAFSYMPSQPIVRKHYFRL